MKTGTGVCVSWPLALCLPLALTLAPSPDSQFVFTDPGPQFVFTGPGPHLVFTDLGTKFVFTGSARGLPLGAHPNCIML